MLPRITGKRQVGQLASLDPLDLVLLLELSNAVQNAVNAGDNSVPAGIILSVTLIGFNYLLGYATYRSKAVKSFVEGLPQLLIDDGRRYENMMHRTCLTHHELNAALRGGWLRRR